MSYLVLARKYRPQSFDSVVGQTHITQALANAIIRDKVPHALLFTGPRGVGKTTSARLLARALNCTGRELPSEQEASQDERLLRQAIEPCGTCQNCIEIARSSSLAVWEIDGASNNSVDNVRELIDSLRTSAPPHARYKIYIIDEVHMLSTSAFNALLKSLEEPPPHTVFIFATTEPHKIPETVLSRCQRYDFRGLAIESIVEQLRSIVTAEQLDVSDDVLDFIARRSQGGMRDSQSMLDRIISYAGDKITIERAQEVFGAVGIEFFQALAQAILSEAPALAFEKIDEVFSRSIDTKVLLDDFLTFWRNLLIVASLREDKKGDLEKRVSALLVLDEASRNVFLELSEAVSSFDATRLFKLAEETVRRALSSNYPRYVLEAGVAEMSAMPSLKPLAEILSLLQSGSVGESDLQKKKPSGSPEPIANQIEVSNSSVTAAPALSLSVVGSDSFNPSWQEFITFLKERNEFVLSAYLRRVTAVKFIPGVLEIEGLSFDLESLQEKKSFAGLQDCLVSYSGINQWSVKFREMSQRKEAGFERGAMTAGTPDSLASTEVKERRDRAKQIIEEAKNQEAVKQALSIFEGSIIERVGVLDSERK